MTEEFIGEARGTVETPTAARAHVESAEPTSTRNALLCVLLFTVGILWVYPNANMPFIDDFSYTKTALDFARTGHFHYNGWATAMLGWLVPWGALFIKLFGFSFNVMRLSMLPIAMTSVYLFHRILERAGINRGNAVLGAVTMALSPLFLPLSATYMTDVPGLFVILVCIYMCQRAVAARTDTTALVWLCSAMVVNVAGGTVRQIAWLGALVMVPSTAWLMRQRRGMKMTGIVLWVMSLIGILTCLHWFNRQPYSVPEHILDGPMHVKMLVHLAAQLAKTLLCLLLVVLPVLAAWLPAGRKLSYKAQLRFVGIIVALAMLAGFLAMRGTLDLWLMPWLTVILEMQDASIPKILGIAPLTSRLLMELGISSLIAASTIILVGHIVGRSPFMGQSRTQQASSWNGLLSILGPFSLSYLMLLAPRGTFSHIQDRYVLGLVPAAIIVLLKLYQERVSARLPVVSVITFVLFAIYSIAGAHDFFAESRALVNTIQMVQDSGVVPRRSIEAGLSEGGLASDGWAQIAGGGHINESRIKIPVGAYNPNVPKLRIPEDCSFWFTSDTPAIIPKYFVVQTPRSCFADTAYPQVRYTTWLPPFHRTLYVQQLKSSDR